MARSAPSRHTTFSRDRAAALVAVIAVAATVAIAAGSPAGGIGRTGVAALDTTTTASIPPFAGAPSSMCPLPRHAVQDKSFSIQGLPKTVALTFDGGPGPDTQKILNILESFHVRATFFNIGQNEVDHPSMVREMAHDGFLLGDHTFDHPNLLTLTPAEEANQIDGVIDEQRQLVGSSPCVFRPPFGNWDQTTLSIANSRQMTLWLWNVDTQDWMSYGLSTKARAQKMVSTVETEGIQLDKVVILMHDQTISTPATVAALPVIIQFFLDNGYTFVDLLGRSGVPATCGPPGQESAEVPGATLDAGDSLAAGESVASPNGEFTLAMRTDGDLEVEMANGGVLWTSGTEDNPGARLVVEDSGDVVVLSAAGTVLWSSRTPGVPGASLVLGDDGALQVVHGDATRWNSRTRLSSLGLGESLEPGWLLASPNGRCHLAQLASGRLELTDSTGQMLWEATGGLPGASTSLSASGALQVIDPSQAVGWDSQSAGQGVTQLRITNHGNVVLSGAGGQPLWVTP